MLYGAYDCFVETSSMEELRVVLRRAIEFHLLKQEVEKLRSSQQINGSFHPIIACGPKMRAILEFSSKVATTDATVLLTGETGTGKEILARAIHDGSARSAAPFVPVCCTSLPETLIEAELFGHEKGAFTGAFAARQGRFEAAGKGTIFLDEIGDLPPELQVKLLRVLQERSFERLGSNQSRPMEARIICATNRDLRSMVKQGLFRADLYYRLNTVEIHLPPLRERREDISALAHTFLHFYAQKLARPVQRMSLMVIVALEEYGWSGNIRELQHVIERGVVICDGPELGIEHLPPDFCELIQETNTNSFEDEVKNFKRRLVIRALIENQNNKVQAARFLKIARSSMHRLIEELNIPEVSVAISPPSKNLEKRLQSFGSDKFTA
jgi:DNA-binding NtrC family response regulator